MTSCPTRVRTAVRSGTGCMRGCWRLPPGSTLRVLMLSSGGRWGWRWRWRAVSLAAWSSTWTGCGRWGTCRSATATDRGCCLVSWRSSNPVTPPCSVPPICAGWPRSPPTSKPWRATPVRGSPAAWSRPERWSCVRSGRSNGCWRQRWPTAPRSRRWPPAATRSGRAGPRCLVGRSTRPTPGSLRCCAATCRAPRSRSDCTSCPAARRSTAARSSAGRPCRLSPTPCTRWAASSFHEANPGHHLQTALELEAAGRHALRRNASELQGAAYVEGWGLYSERLADEMGLYAGDVERLGMLGLQALRAARLVADTGIHALGWTREQSIATLRASGCDEWSAASETDRYAAIPGQALTYKLGQLEIEGLRQQWVARGGQVRGFHDTLLALGLLPLASLRSELQAEGDRPR